jgi:hypothetical protein
MDLKQLLMKHSACREACEWGGGKTPQQAWRTCHRGDWMLWIAAKVGVERKALVRIACDCVEPAMRFVPDGEKQPQTALDVARRWCDGEATIEEVLSAARAADFAADAAYAAARAAARAAEVGGTGGG